MYSVEVSTKKRWPKWCFRKPSAIRKSVTGALGTNSGSDDHQKRAQTEWDRLAYAELKVVRPSNLVLGHFTKKNVQVFVFEQATPELTSVSEVTLNIIVISAVNIEQMFDISFRKLEQVLDSAKVELLTDSHLLVFPYNSKEGDIFDQNIKVRATFEKRPFLEPREWIKVAFVILLTTISIIIAQASGPVDTQNINFFLGLIPIDAQLFARALLTACILYVILDLIPLRVVPKLFEKNGLQIKISDLSSIVETREQSLITSVVEDSKPAPLTPPQLPSAYPSIPEAQQ